MKILVLGFGKIAYMPYMNFYLDGLANDTNDVHIMCWNRDGKDDITLYIDATLHEFKLYQEDEIPKLRKITNFAKYRRYAKTLIKNEKFDFIIVLHTLPGILLYDVLKGKYKDNYILDYRDFTFENIKAYKKIIHRLVDYSRATFVSSDAYREYLPKHDKIYTSHNILIDPLQLRERRSELQRNHTPLRISYWGFIRHERVNKAIVTRMANDIRFELHYYGREQKTAHNLKQYCADNNINNVYFHGEYEPKDRYEFAKSTDIIHNLYENDTATSKAMGNKYYDGIVFYVPQLCSRDSFMGKQVAKDKVGLSCNPYCQSFADDVYAYYYSIAWDDFESNCDLVLKNVIQDHNKGVEVLNRIFHDGAQNHVQK